MKADDDLPLAILGLRSSRCGAGGGWGSSSSSSSGGRAASGSSGSVSGANVTEADVGVGD